MFRKLLMLSTILVVGTTSAHAVETTLQLQLSTAGDFERRTVQYDCGTETPLAVTYLNVAPNFLAILTPPDQTEPIVFASAVSASGARYASGHWVWWNKGTDGTLQDVTLGDDAEPTLSCTEFVDTP